MTQNAVVDAGEDLSMEVNIPTASRRPPISGTSTARQSRAQRSGCTTSSTRRWRTPGVYRLDAFDADGSMVVSMDISARVIDDAVPQSGDTSLPLAPCGPRWGSGRPLGLGVLCPPPRRARIEDEGISCRRRWPERVASFALTADLNEEVP